MQLSWAFRAILQQQRFCCHHSCADSQYNWVVLSQLWLSRTVKRFISDNSVISCVERVDTRYVNRFMYRYMLIHDTWIDSFIDTWIISYCNEALPLHVLWYTILSFQESTQHYNWVQMCPPTVTLFGPGQSVTVGKCHCSHAYLL